MELRKELYKKIKDHRGAIQEVAERMEVSRDTVRRALNGIVENPDPAILEMVSTVILEREERLSKAAKMLKKASAIAVVL